MACAFLGLQHSHNKDKNCYSYLLTRRKYYLDTTMICAVAQKEGIKMYNTLTLEAIKITQQLQEDLKQHYQDDKAKRDKCMLSKAN